MRTITIANKNIEVPSAWNELLDEQLKMLARLLAEKQTLPEVRLKLLLFCIGARVRQANEQVSDVWALTLGSKTVFLSAAELEEMARLFDFLFDTEGRLDVRLTRTPFFRLETRRMMLMGPEDGLTNISYGQFVQAQTLLPLVQADFDSHINDFLCVLWKDLRFEPTEDGAPEWLYGVPDSEKRVMLWYYIGSLRFIAEKFPRLFSGGEAATDENPFDAQQRIIDELAGGDVTKKEQVRRSPLYDVLYTLEMAIERRDKERKEEA